jgi:hypothetical protein
VGTIPAAVGQWPNRFRSTRRKPTDVMRCDWSVEAGPSGADFVVAILSGRSCPVEQHVAAPNCPELCNCAEVSMIAELSGDSGGSQGQDLCRGEGAAPTPSEGLLAAVLSELRNVHAKAERIEAAVSARQDDYMLELMIRFLIDLREIEHHHRAIEGLANKLSGALYNLGGFEEIAPAHLTEFNPALHRPSRDPHPTKYCENNGRIKRTKRIGVMKDNRAFKRFAAEVELYKFQAASTKAPQRVGGDLFASTNQPQNGAVL